MKYFLVLFLALAGIGRAASPTPTWSPTTSPTPTWTLTNSPTPSWTPTATQTWTPTVSQTWTFSPTLTATPTWTPTITQTFTFSPTVSPTPSWTPTVTLTSTPTQSFTFSPTVTPTFTITLSFTTSPTLTPSPTPLLTPLGELTPNTTPATMRRKGFFKSVTTNATGKFGAAHIYITSGGTGGTLQGSDVGNTPLFSAFGANSGGGVQGALTVAIYTGDPLLLVLSTRFQAANGWNVVTLPQKSVPAGTYYIAVEGDDTLNIGTKAGTDKYMRVGWIRFPERPDIYTDVLDSSIYADWYHY